MKAFFLDRDGTLNVDYNFVHKPEEWTWCRGALEAIKWLNQNEFKIIVVTNQSGISRGHYSVNDVNQLHNWVDTQLSEKGLRIDDWYIAPHHPKFDPAPHRFDPADRKPETGMFQKAIRKHGIDPAQSFMAGDKVSDLKPALELGIKPFFIKSRHAKNQNHHWLERNQIALYTTLLEVLQKNF
ncbi:D-glycero-alpha-D-manno-heptose-1,7-bisphosphate 7-phosphatase [Rhodohalobacter halophilus]|uniref:D-glycero-alpha-D-manno-heptose-1,7-bisphosphate 7-phosphatase n=1 Tax=Rhodohalobacter halophilus TaxID=1812810 RepID=UPI00083F8BD1|nr:HAD family hydrolase [Rhodohalobacter halophilus]